MNKHQTWQVTPAQYTAMQARINAAGVAISGDSGTVKAQGGVVISWSYDSVTLEITVVTAPWGFTGVAEKKIAAAVNDALHSGTLVV
jgi:hypothetical protein